MTFSTFLFFVVYLFAIFNQPVTAILLAFCQPAIATSVRYASSSVSIQELL